MDNATVPQNPEWLSTINEALQKNVQDVLAGKINNVTARCNLKKAIIAAGYHLGTAHIEPDSPEDLLCDSRLNLVIKTNVEMAQGHRDWNANQNAVILDQFPALELFRLEGRDNQRDWLSRWRLAGAQTGDPIGTGWIITPDERMIALKNHLIWDRLGDPTIFSDGLGKPWPPFAFDSGMWVMSVERSKAEAIGLITSTGVINLHKTLPPSPLLTIESERITAFFWNVPKLCDHCGEEKPFKLLKTCDACGESICPDCVAKGCTGPEPPPPPGNAMQCFSTAEEKMMWEKLPLRKDVAEQV
ncbi:MAG TPA: hypothetical protein VE344_07065 [Methylomirabilota bacterium]|nr:hypothetical protein [Methylomirabilota bacterium]